MKRDDATYEDPKPFDPPMCSRFGAGAFPCGPVHKIRVTVQSRGPRYNDMTRRTAICAMHYVFFTTEIGVSGGASGFKLRAKNTAFQRLAVDHLDEFQQHYEAALAELCATTTPPINPDLLLGRESS